MLGLGHILGRQRTGVASEAFFLLPDEAALLFCDEEVEEVVEEAPLGPLLSFGGCAGPFGLAGVPLNTLLVIFAPADPRLDADMEGARAARQN